jgi:hypothetical protein
MPRLAGERQISVHRWVDGANIAIGKQQRGIGIGTVRAGTVFETASEPAILERCKCAQLAMPEASTKADAPDQLTLCIEQCQQRCCFLGNTGAGRMYVATRWLQLANEGCLDVRMDPARGLMVREVLGGNSLHPAPASNVIRDQFRELLFKKLNELPDGRLLQIFEVIHAFQIATGESLKSYESEFVEVVDELCDNSYIRHQRKGGVGMSLFCKGIEFDSWKADMTTKVPEPTGHTFNFNAAVGSVQSGSHSVAHVQQSFDPRQLAGLKSALEAVLAEFARVDLPADTREEAQGLIESAIVEIDKPKPNKLSLRSLLGGVATTVQTLGSASDAYKALTTLLQRHSQYLVFRFPEILGATCFISLKKFS